MVLEILNLSSSAVPYDRRRAIFFYQMKTELTEEVAADF
ncbi:hypothetical protein VDG1235_604 [Verrucomicrobiia bacterium DG1235]|nr:hypothetical protein VDG1235_604 [Verrucomicrobiae bacterium DG1235]